MSQHQDYDKIIRENIEKAIPTLLEKLCNLRPEKLEDLPTSLQKTRERRPDFLKRARSSEPGGDYIVHVEFQTDSDSRMQTNVANSDNPEEIVLAILGDFKGEKSADVVRTILTNLNKNIRDKRTLHKFLTQLEILSNLRNLQPEIVKQVEAMPITYDITTDIRYQQGMAAAKKETVAKLLDEGKKSLKEIALFVEMPIDFVIEVQNEMTAKEKKNK